MAFCWAARSRGRHNQHLHPASSPDDHCLHGARLSQAITRSASGHAGDPLRSTRHDCSAALVILYTSLPPWTGSLAVRDLTGYLSTLWPTVVIFVAALVALVKYNMDLVWIIPAAGLLGLLLY